MEGFSMNSGTQLSYQGYEVCLWPLDFLNITAGPDANNHIVSGVSNSGLYDNGWYINTICPLYAPCTMELVRSYPTGTANGHTQMWRSVNPVWIPSSNTPMYITIALSHSDTLPYTAVGTIINQGTYFYNTGTYGYASGAHVHLILYIGSRSTMFPTGYNSYVGGNIWYSDNPPNTIADMFYLLGDETIIRTGGYTWSTWSGGSNIKKYITFFTAIKKKRRLKSNEIKYTL